MPMLEGITDVTWTSEGPLAFAEVWAVRRGSVLLTAEVGTLADDAGIRVNSGQRYAFPAGATVQYRSASSVTATVWREVGTPVPT